MKKNIFLIAGLIFFLTALLCPAADEQKKSDQNQLFYTANHYYETRDYAKASEEYLKILGLGIESGSLYYNIGNSFFKLGKIGSAILYYEKALRLMPQDGDLKSNLAYARSLVGNPSYQVPNKNPVVSAIKATFKDFNLNAIAVCGALLYLIVILLQASFILNPILRKKLGVIFILILTLFVLNLTAFGIRYYDEEMLKRAIVIQKEVDCRYEPIDKSTVYYKLQEGDDCFVIKTRDGWRQIKRLDGKIGWVSKDAVEEI